MSFAFPIFLSLICGSFSDPIPATSNELTNPPGKGLDIGEWGTMDRCPAGEVAATFAVMTQPYQGKGDDTGVNGIKFRCAKARSKDYKGVISSTNGSHGTWGFEFPCQGGVIVGYQLQIDPYDASIDDCWGVVNVRVFCSVGMSFTGAGAQTKKELGSAKNATWTPELKCPPAQAICGIQTRVLDTGVDKCGITNVKMECCEEAAAAGADAKPADQIAAEQNVQEAAKGKAELAAPPEKVKHADGKVPDGAGEPPQAAEGEPVKAAEGGAVAKPGTDGDATKTVDSTVREAPVPDEAAPVDL